MKRKSIFSVLFLFMLTAVVALTGFAKRNPGKWTLNREKWWDEKLGDSWNIWLDKCEDEDRKEMFLAAFAKLEDSMIDGSFLGISPFLEGDAELSFVSKYDHAGTEYIHIKGQIEQWSWDDCEYWFPVEILIVVDIDGGYEVYNNFAKRNLAGYLQEEDIEFRLSGYSGSPQDDIVDPLFIEYMDYAQIDDFWEKFKCVCINIDRWQKEHGICMDQTVRIGERAYSADHENLTMRYQEIALDFSKLARDENEFARLQEAVQEERMALIAEMEEEVEEEMEETKEQEIGSYWIYICQPGDTLWEISKTYLGSTDKIQAICEDPYNRIADADLIYAGQWIYISEELFDQ